MKPLTEFEKKSMELFRKAGLDFLTDETASQILDELWQLHQKELQSKLNEITDEMVEDFENYGTIGNEFQGKRNFSVEQKQGISIGIEWLKQKLLEQ